ncbi:hypothetical protein KJ819_03365 [Patescibacteria group bacterium]|nr:hypothetical protein [Patescibacteria group bacterium]MBU1500510.1 hypothetical protein [Patescibacteria group bacterium]MBU2080691.1 hypothetical protein [Patescibacteria group bacterium]MBU2123796.1 hypothetical protein [Patescibacteria group bacterium]MBU2194913.1 hypothetical protein [Patescibacteria group bacterium]
MSRKNLTYIAVGIVVLGAVAYFFMGRTPEIDTITTDSAVPTSEAQSTFLLLAAQLDPISFSPKVLNDPRFLQLQDIHTLIVPEASGRTDPFAPLGGAAAQP